MLKKNIELLNNDFNFQQMSVNSTILNLADLMQMI